MKYSDLTERREYDSLTYQDYGAFVDEATLYEFDNRWFLRLANGYQNADNEDWYELDAEPTKWPDNSKNDSDYLVANCGTDQSENGENSDLFEFFGVTGKKTDAPESTSLFD